MIKWIGLLFCIPCCFCTCKQTETHTSNLSEQSATTSMSGNQNEAVIRDTVTAHNYTELTNLIRSYRQINLLGKDYEIEDADKSSLRIENIHHLDIIGEQSTRIIGASEAVVVSMEGSNNISISNLTLISNPEEQQQCQGAVMYLTNSSDVSLDKIKIVGDGSTGLYTKKVRGLELSNSEVTGCDCLIFELEDSQDCLFDNVLFSGNKLATSVLGGFTESTHDVTFYDCRFIDNEPASVGNPAFNFAYNSEKFPVTMTRCIFKNNKGFKWYGDQINLIDCDIDTADFVE